MDLNSPVRQFETTDNCGSSATDEQPQNVRLATDDSLVQGQLLDGSDLPRGRGFRIGKSIFYPLRTRSKETNSDGKKGSCAN